MRKRAETRDQACLGALPPPRESPQLYASRCSMPALAEIAEACAGGPADAAALLYQAAGKVFEPSAFVVCSGHIASIISWKQTTVTMRHASALPLGFAAALEEGGESGN